VDAVQRSDEDTRSSSDQQAKLPESRTDALVCSSIEWLRRGRCRDEVGHRAACSAQCALCIPAILRAGSYSTGPTARMIRSSYVYPRQRQRQRRRCVAGSESQPRRAGVRQRMECRVQIACLRRLLIPARLCVLSFLARFPTTQLSTLRGSSARAQPPAASGQPAAETDFDWPGGIRRSGRW